MNILILILAPFLGALFVSVYGRNGRSGSVLSGGIAISEFVFALFVFCTGYAELKNGQPISLYTPEICGTKLHFEMDGFRAVYALIATFMWMMTVVFSNEYGKHHERQNRYYVFMLMTLGATVGVFLSANLFTTFLLFEIMSFTSYTWVAQEETEAALRAAATYLAVAVIGGMVMLMGLFLIYHEIGSLEFDALFHEVDHTVPGTVMYAAGACLLFGFGAKAGAFPLHIWLPKAHPVAPAPASALLSGILTKTGIFGIIIVSTSMFPENELWGKLILILGTLTMFGGALLAVFSIDLKRTLACSSMSQIGFIMVGIGMQCILGEENALAVHGTFLHMVNHSLIKLVLFMVAGVVFMNLHSLELNEIRGFGRKKKLLMVIYLIGALAIAGIPMFSGYISKTLLHESILEHADGLTRAIEYIFLFSGGLTLAYMTKLFVAIFIEKNQNEKLQRKYDDKKKYMNPVSTIVLSASALVLLVWGLFPKLMDKAAELSQSFMRLEEFGERVSYFSFENLKGALITLIVASAVYFGFIRTCLMDKKGCYVNRWPGFLDMENLIYRPVVLKILPFVFGVICRAMDSLVDGMVVLLRKTVYRDARLPYTRQEGSWISEKAGKLFNRFGNGQKDYVHIFAMKEMEIKENERIITGSLSFGLMLFGMGFILTLAYLLLW